MALGASGSGKTSLVNPAKELLLLAGVPEVLGQDRIASGSGLLRMLTIEPRRVCFLDEFGHMLQQIGAPGAGIHSRQILTEITRLYSEAGTRATRAPPTPAASPSGSRTRTSACSAWRRPSSSGAPSARPRSRTARSRASSCSRSAQSRVKDAGQAVPRRTVAAIKAVLEAIRGRARGNLGQPELLTVPFDAAADAAHLALQETMQGCAEYAEINGMRGRRPILRRVAEVAQRIALISAIGRDPGAPVMTCDDFEIGHALARWSACEMVRNIASHIADNQTERDVNDVERRDPKGRPGGNSEGQAQGSGPRRSGNASSTTSSRLSRSPAGSRSSAAAQRRSPGSG